MKPGDIRAFRHSLGLGAEAFARAVGVADGRLVRRWEAGDVRPHGSVIALIELAIWSPGGIEWLKARAARSSV